MKTNNTTKIFSTIFGVLFAIAMAAPYILFRNQIQHYALMGYIGVAMACAISNASIFLPTSSTVIILAAASTLSPLLCVLVGSCGTALGEQSSYICGRIGRIGFDDTGTTERKALKWLKKNAFMTIFIAASMPLPALFDIVGVASGAMKIRWSTFAIAAVIGKMLKFLVAVTVFYHIIPSTLQFIPEPMQSALYSLIEQLGIAI